MFELNLDLDFMLYCVGGVGFGGKEEEGEVGEGWLLGGINMSDR